MNKNKLFVVAVLAWAAGAAHAAETTLMIDAGQSAGKVSPLHTGLMTEEINHSYDGGLYAELVQNRSFLDNAKKPVHWSLVETPGASASIALDHAKPLNNVLSNSLRLDVTAASKSAWAGVANDGYWGIPVKPHTKYRASFYARGATNLHSPIRIAIQSEDGSKTFAETTVTHIGPEWKWHAAILKTGNVAPTSKAKLVLSVSEPATVWFTLVSLFPPTYHDRPNGTRIDIMELLAGMKPSFLRFPGGNFVEGDTLETRFDWKKTVGPLDHRPGHAGCWGYRASDGFGLLEFLEWCEDLHMEPVLAVYAGYNLNHTHVEPGAALKPFVQDALDEIEYTTADSWTKWGLKRAQGGHPNPFKIKYVEIGNEDWFDNSGSYDTRFTQFYDAIKAKFPQIKCISTVGNEHPAKQRVQSRRPDVLDEHYYSPAAEFDHDSMIHWDKYDPTGPEIFVGEWAAYEDVKPWEPPSRHLPPTPSLKSALADAAWMAGMERHSDLITMQCYAPLFVNVNPGARQWRPNLIGYDALNAFGSPSYYAISLFSQNHGDEILNATTTGAPLNYSVTKNSKTGAIYVKLVNPDAEPHAVQINVRGVKSIKWQARATTLSAASDTESNSIDDPGHIVPIPTKIPVLKPEFSYSLPGFSLVVIELK